MPSLFRLLVFGFLLSFSAQPSLAMPLPDHGAFEDVDLSTPPPPQAQGVNQEHLAQDSAALIAPSLTPPDQVRAEVEREDSDSKCSSLQPYEFIDEYYYSKLLCFPRNFATLLNNRSYAEECIAFAQKFPEKCQLLPLMVLFLRAKFPPLTSVVTEELVRDTETEEEFYVLSTTLPATGQKPPPHAISASQNLREAEDALAEIHPAPSERTRDLTRNMDFQLDLD